MPVHLEGRLADSGRGQAAGFCPIERTMALVGTRSAMVLMREASYGTTRFDDFVSRTGLTDAVTSARLKELVDAGLLDKEPYREPGQRTRLAYVLSDAGSDLLPTLVALASWGTKHLPRRHAPRLTHQGCGKPVESHIECTAGHRVAASEIVASA